jgi:CRP-like cAMP-binding protein
MPLNAIIGELSEFAIFGGIEARALARVSDLFESGSYPAGAHIIEQETSGNRFYIVTAGRVQVSVHSTLPNETRTESVLATHGRGATFGEMELLDTQKRSATITAIEATDTIELTNMGLYEIFLRDPDVFRMMIMNLARDLSRRLRIADQQLALIQAEPPES